MLTYRFLLQSHSKAFTEVTPDFDPTSLTAAHPSSLLSPSSQRQNLHVNAWQPRFAGPAPTICHLTPQWLACLALCIAAAWVVARNTDGLQITDRQQLLFRWPQLQRSDKSSPLRKSDSGALPPLTEPTFMVEKTV